MPRWLEENKPIVFGMILNQKEEDSPGRHVNLLTRTELIEAIKITPELRDKFKRLSDGILFSKVKEELSENPIYIFINHSADGFMARIRNVMQLSDMAEESVAIELKS